MVGLRMSARAIARRCISPPDQRDGLVYVRLRKRGVAQGDVVAHGSRNEQAVLEHDPDPVSEGLGVNRRHGRAVDEDFAGLRFEGGRRQFENCRLAGSVCADERDDVADAECGGEVLDYGFCICARIGERHVAELEALHGVDAVSSTPWRRVRKYLVERIDAFAERSRFGEEGYDSLHGLHRREKEHLIDDHVPYRNRALGCERSRNAKDGNFADNQKHTQKSSERDRQTVHRAVAVFEIA